MEGWIKLHRQLLESEIFASSKGLRIWIWLLLKVQFDKKYFPIKIGGGESTVTLQRGQLLFGRFKAEEELGIDGSTIYKWLKKLEQMGMIELQSNNHYTIISIANFDKYNEKSNSHVATEGTPEEHHVATEGTPSNTYKNVKEGKESKESKEGQEEPPDFLETCMNELLTSQTWQYSFHKTCNVEPSQILSVLREFNLHTISLGKEITTLKDYKDYLNKWKLNKDRIEKKPNYKKETLKSLPELIKIK